MIALKIAINPVASVVGAVSIAETLLDCNSEFIGDGAQGLSGTIADAVKKRYARKKERKYLQELFDNTDVLDNIFSDIKESESGNSVGRFGQWFRNRFGNHKSNHRDYMIQLAQKGMTEKDLCDYMNDASATYRNLDDNQKEVIGIAVHSAMRALINTRWNKIGSYEDKTMVAFLQYFIDDATNGLREDIDEIKQMIVALTQTNGDISLQEIVMSTDPRKYAIRKCPNCGYNGNRLYTDTSRTVHCAACGSSVEVVEIDHEEVCKKVDGMVKAQLSVVMREVGATTDKNMQSVAQKLDVLESAVEKLNANFNSGEIPNSVVEQISIGVKRMIDSQYLDSCLNKYSNNTLEMPDEKICEIFADYVERVNEQIAELNDKSDKEIVDALNEYNDVIRDNNRIVNEKLDSLDRQINGIHIATMSKLDGLQELSGEILMLIRLACSREYMEQCMQNIGSTINNSVVSVVDKLNGGFQALAESSLKKVFDKLNEIIVHLNEIGNRNYDCDYKDCIAGSYVFDEQSKYIEAQNAKLQVKIDQSYEILQHHSRESAQKLQEIIDTQDIILKNILSLNISGVKITSGYGKVPTEYLLNEGFDSFSFKCPFCGVTEARQMNSEQYCYCSVCKNKYIPLKTEKQGYLGDAYNLKKAVATWKNLHTPLFIKLNHGQYRVSVAKLADGCDCIRDGIMIIPDADVKNEVIEEITSVIVDNCVSSEYFNGIYTLFIGGNLKKILLADQYFKDLHTLVFIGAYHIEESGIGKCFDAYKKKLKNNAAKLCGCLAPLEKKQWVKNYV